MSSPLPGKRGTKRKGIIHTAHTHTQEDVHVHIQSRTRHLTHYTQTSLHGHQSCFNDQNYSFTVTTRVAGTFYQLLLQGKLNLIYVIMTITLLVPHYLSFKYHHIIFNSEICNIHHEHHLLYHVKLLFGSCTNFGSLTAFCHAKYAI